MRYIEVPGRIDDRHRLILDESLDVIKPQRVKIDIWFRDEDEEEDREETKAEILESIRAGFRDCLAGRTSPVGEKWDEFTIETTGSIDDLGQLILDQPLTRIEDRDVDVIIWFIRDKQSAPAVFEGIEPQKDSEALAQELISSQT